MQTEETGESAVAPLTAAMEQLVQTVKERGCRQAELRRSRWRVQCGTEDGCWEQVRISRSRGQRQKPDDPSAVPIRHISSEDGMDTEGNP